MGAAAGVACLLRAGRFPVTDGRVAPTVGAVEVGARPPRLLRGMLLVFAVAASLLAAVLTLLPPGRLQLEDSGTVRRGSKNDVALTMAAAVRRVASWRRPHSTTSLKEVTGFLAAVQQSQSPCGGQTAVLPQGDSERRPRRTAFGKTLDSRFKPRHKCTETECGGGCSLALLLLGCR